MKPFENIDSITIERIRNKYVESNGSEEHRFVVLGEWTVDILNFIMMLSDDPDNSDQHRKVFRGNSHKRARVDNSRFSSAVNTGFNKFRDLKY